jgi:predicted transcriptional regulator
MDNIEVLIKYINDIGLSQVNFAKKIKYNETSLCKIIKRRIPITKPFKRRFKLSEGFEVEDLLRKKDE